MSRTSLAGPLPRRPAEGAPPRLFAPPAWDWFQAGDVGWWVLPEWRDVLLGPEGLRLEHWRHEGRLTTIKAGPHRIVYRADLEPGSVYIKHFLAPDFRSRVRQWVRRGKGRNEARRAQRLAGLGVPTITPIALGERRHRKFLFDNILITRAITGTIPLDAYLDEVLPALDPGPRERARRGLAERLGELTARLHVAGLVHEDFHPGNLLVRPDADGLAQLALVDLDALKQRERLDWDDVRRNLTIVNHAFWLRTGRPDRARFLRAYLAARGASPPEPKALARQIEAATRTWAERLWRRRARRCRGSSKEFLAAEGVRTWAVASRDLDPDELQGLLADPDAPFRHEGSRILKDSRTTTVAEVRLRVGGQPTAVIYKRFNRKKFLDPMLSLFRPSRAWRAWLAGAALAARGVPTPRNLAVLGRVGGQGWQPLPRETYLATIRAEPSITLRDYAFDVLPTLEPAARRRQVSNLAAALATLLRTLHDRSLSHRDLKAANILIEGDPTADRPTLSLIDLVGVTLQHPLAEGRRLQNLARVQVSLADAPGRTRTDALRFLLAYLPAQARGRARWKRIWRAVERRTRSKVAANRRRGRPLS